MNKRIYYQELECYGKATEDEKKKLNNIQYFDLDQLPSEGLQKEFAEFIMDRSRQVSILTIKSERYHFNNICKFLQKSENHVNSLAERDSDQWLRKLKGWMLQNGFRLSKEKINAYGNRTTERSALIRYFDRVLRYTAPPDERTETEKDIWRLDKLGIEFRKLPIRNTQTLNFTKILQDDIRNQVKKATWFHMKYEAIDTIKRELTVMRQFSAYLDKEHQEVVSCEDIDRNLIEEYLIYRKVEQQSGHGLTDDIIKLRNVLETVGKLYNYSHLEKLFLNTDFPPVRKSEFKSYSDAEMKRLNAAIVKMEEQIARCMIIHQMLGTRISDTLTLQQDCLYKENGQDMIRIFQPKTRMYVKPVSSELAQLICKAIEHTVQKYGKRKYIFVDDKDSDKPLQYNTIQWKVLTLIWNEKLKDDNGKLFGFGSHLYRHYYGVKLTEMHLDDWTIAKLLGHKDIRSVRYYRKMSNQRLADDTREYRKYLSQIILDNMDGWGEEYEQIRQND